MRDVEARFFTGRMPFSHPKNNVKTEGLVCISFLQATGCLVFHPTNSANTLKAYPLNCNGSYIAVKQ